MRTMPMIWNANGKTGNMPCAVCGKQINRKTAWAVHVINGGGDVLHPEYEAHYQPDGGDMGCHLVGPECRKKFGDFAFPWR